VVDWYREYYDGADAAELVERQLARYVAGPRAVSAASARTSA
jgi:hypothetical protein